jgi:hypothetical protein
MKPNDKVSFWVDKDDDNMFDKITINSSNTGEFLRNKLKKEPIKTRTKTKFKKCEIKRNLNRQAKKTFCELVKAGKSPESAYKFVGISQNVGRGVNKTILTIEKINLKSKFIKDLLEKLKLFMNTEDTSRKTLKQISNEFYLQNREKFKDLKNVSLATYQRLITSKTGLNFSLKRFGCHTLLKQEDNNLNTERKIWVKKMVSLMQKLNLELVYIDECAFNLNTKSLYG